MLNTIIEPSIFAFRWCLTNSLTKTVTTTDINAYLQTKPPVIASFHHQKKKGRGEGSPLMSTTKQIKLISTGVIKNYKNWKFIIEIDRGEKKEEREQFISLCQERVQDFWREETRVRYGFWNFYFLGGEGNSPLSKQLVLTWKCFYPTLHLDWKNWSSKKETNRMVWAR